MELTPEEMEELGHRVEAWITGKKEKLIGVAEDERICDRDKLSKLHDMLMYPEEELTLGDAVLLAKLFVTAANTDTPMLATLSAKIEKYRLTNKYLSMIIQSKYNNEEKLVLIRQTLTRTC